MAKRPARATPHKTKTPPKRSLRSRILRLIAGVVLGIAALFLLLILAFNLINPPSNIYQMQERWRLGALQKTWAAPQDIAPDMARAVVAAEDANFCLHWGFDLNAIRQAAQSNGRGGASGITQQTVKNVFLWPARSWTRKAVEALLTPVVELVWSKKRILNVYLNVAEFGEGIFGIQAAAMHYFNVDAKDLTSVQSARLAAILPAPKRRDPVKPSAQLRKRSRAILSGMRTIAADGRDSCFLP